MSQEAAYRKAERRVAKERAKSRLLDALSNAKSSLMKAQGDMEEFGTRGDFEKLCRLTAKLEWLENVINLREAK